MSNPNLNSAGVAEVSAFSLKDFLSSFFLLELLKGMRLTGRYAFRSKITLEYPEEKNTFVTTLSWFARVAPL